MELKVDVIIPHWCDDYKGVETQIIEAVRDKLVADARQDLIAEARKLVLEAIGQQIATLVAEAMEQPIAPTNRYGEVTGESRTLRAVMVEEVNHWLSQPVDRRNGSPLGNRSANTLARHEWTVRNQACQVIAKEFKKEIDAARKTIREEMNGAVEARIRSVIYDIAGIKALPTKV